MDSKVSAEGWERTRRFTNAEARAVIAGWETSGVTLRAYCDARGLPADRLYRWKSRLKLATASAPPGFVHVSVSAPRSTKAALPVRIGVAVRVTCGNLLIELPEGSSGPDLDVVFGALSKGTLCG